MLSFDLGWGFEADEVESGGKRQYPPYLLTDYLAVLITSGDTPLTYHPFSCLECFEGHRLREFERRGVLL